MNKLPNVTVIAKKSEKAIDERAVVRELLRIEQLLFEFLKAHRLHNYWTTIKLNF
jgi:hypothetical protein